LQGFRGIAPTVWSVEQFLELHGAMWRFWSYFFKLLGDIGGSWSHFFEFLGDIGDSS